MQTLPIKPLHNKIFFQFDERIIVNSIGKRAFEDKSSGIVIMGNTDDATKKPRWATVVAVGDAVDSDIKVGTKICVEALRWTDMMTVDGIDFWQTNDEEVLLYEN